MHNAITLNPSATKAASAAFRMTGLLSSLVLLAACATAPGPEQAGEDVVVLQAYEKISDANDPNRNCEAGWFYIYPADVTPHSRDVFYNVVGSSMLSGGGPLPLPRPEQDPRPQQRADGLMEMKVSIASFGPCLGRNGERVIEFTIGECVEGDCPPMRFEAPDDAALVEFRLVEN